MAHSKARPSKGSTVEKPFVVVYHRKPPRYGGAWGQAKTEEEADVIAKSVYKRDFGPFRRRELYREVLRVNEHGVQVEQLKADKGLNEARARNNAREESRG